MFLESVITEHSLIDQNPRKLIGENMSEYLSNDNDSTSASLCHTMVKWYTYHMVASGTYAKVVRSRLSHLFTNHLYRYISNYYLLITDSQSSKAGMLRL